MLEATNLQVNRPAIVCRSAATHALCVNAGPDRPELLEYFDNFAFDDVASHGKLDRRTRLMVQLAAMIACQALGKYRVMAVAALTVGVTPVELKEIVYQAVSYVGLCGAFQSLPLPVTDQGASTGKPLLRRPRADNAYYQNVAQTCLAS
jgi:alkylhydroperoxidase/carboxymuconolactone decarboxylase family protein YurZ